MVVQKPLLVRKKRNLKQSVFDKRETRRSYLRISGKGTREPVTLL